MDSNSQWHTGHLRRDGQLLVNITKFENELVQMAKEDGFVSSSELPKHQQQEMDRAIEKYIELAIMNLKSTRSQAQKMS